MGIRTIRLAGIPADSISVPISALIATKASTRLRIFRRRRWNGSSRVTAAISLKAPAVVTFTTILGLPASGFARTARVRGE